MAYLPDFRRELYGVHRSAGHESTCAYCAALFGVFHVGELVAAVESGVAHAAVCLVGPEYAEVCALVEYAFGYVALVVRHVDRAEACAAHEGVAPYARHAFGDDERLERRAGVERAVANRFERGGQGDYGKGLAAAERIIAYFLVLGVGELHGVELGAAHERAVAYSCDGGGHHDQREVLAKAECVVTDSGNVVALASVGYGRGNPYACAVFAFILGGFGHFGRSCLGVEGETDVVYSHGGLGNCRHRECKQQGSNYQRCL